MSNVLVVDMKFFLRTRNPDAAVSVVVVETRDANANGSLQRRYFNFAGFPTPKFIACKTPGWNHEKLTPLRRDFLDPRQIVLLPEVLKQKPVCPEHLIQTLTRVPQPNQVEHAERKNQQDDDFRRQCCEC